MKYYYFSGGNHILNNKIDKLEENGFYGAMFTYDARQIDYFTQVARHINLSKNIKYLIAIRPYAISPQYLKMINDSISSIMPNRVQVNFISGHIKNNEEKIGGIIGEITDNSSHIDRSNYLIKYIEELNKMTQKNPQMTKIDFFVTTTNQYVFNAISKLKNKMIIPYREYKRGFWPIWTNYQINDQFIPGEKIDLTNQEVMIYVSPVIRETKKEIEFLEKKIWTNDTEFFTYEDFYKFIKNLKNQGIEKLLLHSFSPQEEYIMIEFIKSIGGEV